MILVDTDVVSEPLRRVPEPRVDGWLDEQALETLYLSAITEFFHRARYAVEV